MLRFYDFHESGNGYKVRLLLSQLERPHERIEMDILRGETRTPEFPCSSSKMGVRLAESNAILFFLAEGTEFWPEDGFLRAQVLQWMCFER